MRIRLDCWKGFFFPCPILVNANLSRLKIHVTVYATQCFTIAMDLGNPISN